MTYLQIREQVLRALDLNPDIVGDMVDAANDAIATIVEELAYDVQPLELFETTSPVTIDDTYSQIDVASDFGITNVGTLAGVAVDFKQEATAKLVEWDELSYTAYLKQSNTLDGDMRLRYRWTYTPFNSIILTSWPADGEEWDVYLRYYKLPAAITDNGVPELPVAHHRTIALGAITMFPQYFVGDRVVLFAQFQAQYREGKMRMLSARRASKASRVLVSKSPGRPPGFINWG